MTSDLRHYIMAEDERREEALRETRLSLSKHGPLWNDEVMRSLSAVVGRIKELVESRS